MKHAIVNKSFLQRALVRPQYQLLVDSDDCIKMDYLGRFELLQKSFDEICDNLGLASLKLPRENTSKHKDYRCYYDKSLMKLVAECYREDFEYFDYDIKGYVSGESMV